MAGDFMMRGRSRHLALLVLCLAITAVIVQAGLSATTEVRIVKYANDRSTILAEKTLTYQQMQDELPVLGDGITHYYHQGPVFLDDPDDAAEEALRWNPDEDTNVEEKDMGAVRGTDLRTLCDLVGGMSAGDTLVVKASDGMQMDFAYANVYSPPSRQGPMVLTWYCTGIATCPGPYPDAGYSEGMRLVFFADDTVNPWGIHAFGNFDWHESADPAYWYYYTDGAEKYPTTTGLSVKYVSDLLIYSTVPPGSPAGSSSSGVAGSALSSAGAAPPEDPDRYGFRGKTIDTLTTGTLNGTVYFFSDPRGVPAVVSNRARSFNISVDLPPGLNVTLARLYVAVSGSRNFRTGRGVIPQVLTTIGNRRLVSDRWYFDTDGDEQRHVAATFAYDVLDVIRGNGSSTVAIANTDFEQSVFTADGALLVLAAGNETSPKADYWINEGCDVISSLPEKGILPEDCQTKYPFSGKVDLSGARDATLCLVATGIDQDNTTEHSVEFNTGIFRNFLNGNGSAFAPQILPVTDCLNETGNAATVRSAIYTQDADYLVNRLAVLVAGYRDPGFSASATGAREPAQGLPSPPAGPAETVAPPTEGSSRPVSLETDPGGALIFLDGTYLGKTTPYVLEIEEGMSHTVRFELRGFVPKETVVAAGDAAAVHVSLYAPVRSQKWRLSKAPDDPDGVRHGAVYVNSRPQGAAISVDGIGTGKATPYIITGLAPGSHTVKLALDHQDSAGKGTGDFFFGETGVLVMEGVLSLVDVNGISHAQEAEVIIDSRQARGVPFSVNGYLYDATIPAKVKVPVLGSFITVYENQSYVSYPIPLMSGDDRYLPLDPRSFQRLAVSVDSYPRGAEVFIDGFRTGYSTPYTFYNLSDGLHRILVTREGYVPQQQLIDLPCRAVPVSATPVHFVLEEYAAGFLYVTSTPPGAGVSIDRLDSGEVTPAFFRSVPAGTHSVKVTGTNSSKTIADVTVNSNTMTNVTVMFTSSTGD